MGIAQRFPRRLFGRRLFHAPGCCFCGCRRCFYCPALRGVATQPVLSVAETQSSVQMSMHRDLAAGQGAAPLQRLDPQTEILKLHRIVTVDHPRMLQRENALQVLPRQGDKGAAALARRRPESAVELPNIFLPRKTVGLFDGLDAAQPQFLRQAPLPKLRSERPIGRNHLDPQLPHGPAHLRQPLLAVHPALAPLAASPAPCKASFTQL